MIALPLEKDNIKLQMTHKLNKNLPIYCEYMRQQ